MNGAVRDVIALRHQEPDRVPIDLGGWQSGISYKTYEGVKKELGVQSPIRISEMIQGLGAVDEEVLRRFHVDTRYVFVVPGVGGDMGDRVLQAVDGFTDEWGVQWFRPATSHYYDQVRAALGMAATVAEVIRHRWPDPSAILPANELRRKAEEIKRSGHAVFTSIAGVFEQATYVRGMEQFYLDIALDPAMTEAIMDRVLEVELARYTQFFSAIGEYVDVIEFWGDLGTQRAPLLSLEHYGRYVKPRERKLVELVRKLTHAKPCLHACGSVRAFIPDLIEMGYEVLNPVQTSAEGMDPVRLKKEYGRDMSFWGAVDTQRVLPFGTEAEVREEVKRVIDALAPGGGFILAPCHNIQAGTPARNVIALFEAALEYGTY